MSLWMQLIERDLDYMVSILAGGKGALSGAAITRPFGREMTIIYHRGDLLLY
jgi:hypothetical protein